MDISSFTISRSYVVEMIYMFAEYRIKEMMITKNMRPPIAIDEEHSIIDAWNTFTVSQGSESL